MSGKHPAVLAVQRERAQSLQLRLVDQITRFAGSINFVYIHRQADGVRAEVVGERRVFGTFRSVWRTAPPREHGQPAGPPG